MSKKKNQKKSGNGLLAALLIVPAKDSNFATEMIKVLCGVNYDKWNISQKLNFNK